MSLRSLLGNYRSPWTHYKSPWGHYCRLIPAIRCGNKKNLFENPTELKTELKKGSFSADFSSSKKNIDTRSQGPGDNFEGLVCESKFK